MHHDFPPAAMPVTLTIKQVPEALAEALRARAAANHRSLQGELMAILATATKRAAAVAEPQAPAYRVKPDAPPAVHGTRLTLRELWERSRRLGSKSPAESTDIVRALRDERHHGH